MSRPTTIPVIDRHHRESWSSPGVADGPPGETSQRGDPRAAVYVIPDTITWYGLPLLSIR